MYTNVTIYANLQLRTERDATNAKTSSMIHSHFTSSTSSSQTILHYFQQMRVLQSSCKIDAEHAAFKGKMQTSLTCYSFFIIQLTIDLMFALMGTSFDSDIDFEPFW